MAQAPYRVIIAGCRTYENFEQLSAHCDSLLLDRHPDVVIVCGMARGADLLGKRFAERKGYGLHPFPADWTTWGRSAGPKRNIQMAKNADALIAFWDYKSRGTKHMIDTARNHNLAVRVFGI